MTRSDAAFILLLSVYGSVKGTAYWWQEWGIIPSNRPVTHTK